MSINNVNPDVSILLTIRKMLGGSANYDAFDTDIKVGINSALMALQQIGVGPEAGFHVSGPEQTWNEFIPSANMLEAAKNYIYLSVKKTFDPPVNSFVMAALEEERKELYERLKEQARFFDPEKGRYSLPASEGEDTGSDWRKSGDYAKQATSSIPLEQRLMFDAIDGGSGDK